MPSFAFTRRTALVAASLVMSDAAPLPRVAPISCGARVGAAADAAPTVIAPQWRAATGSEGIQYAEFSVRLGGGVVQNRVIATRLDPRRAKLVLEVARTDEGTLLPWSIDESTPSARVAFNAGQFTDDGPWGWVVHRGREVQAPGVGGLSAALTVDDRGAASVLSASELAATRVRSTDGSAMLASGARIVEAVQSYPMLLDDGAAPTLLCDAEAIDQEHRDTRLAVATLASGELLVVMTRYEVTGTSMATRLPIGPTTPEMASLMRTLGAVDAVMLDGGLSAQLLLRDGATAKRWPGMRRVPLAIEVRAR